MRHLSATDASRNFSHVLDSVERRGESFVVMRRGRPVATIKPVSGASGKALKDALRRLRPDGDWADELRTLRESLEPEADRWRD
jgi:prevent-host-death family protein